jgi:hypothetical protein
MPQIQIVCRDERVDFGRRRPAIYQHCVAAHFVGDYPRIRQPVRVTRAVNEH